MLRQNTRTLMKMEGVINELIHENSELSAKYDAQIKLIDDQKLKINNLNAKIKQLNAKFYMKNKDELTKLPELKEVLPGLQTKLLDDLSSPGVANFLDA